jgi:hypothetical protein
MLKVGDLIKHLSENNPQSSPARLTFLNFLSHLTEEDDLITSELLEIFFSTCLDYAHWHQNRASLSEEIRSLLEQHTDLSGVKWPEDTQVVEIDNLSDLTDSLQLYLNSIYKKGEKYRLIVEPEKKILAIVLNADHSITVRSFDRKMIIRHGQLEPLKKDFALYYTADLELDPAQIQKLEIAPFVTAQFQAGLEELKGALVRGYTCQKFFDLRGENIATYPKLFYAIKRVEKNFINRQTDPFYQQTVTALEKTIEHVRLGDEDAIQGSMDVLAQSQNALEYVFNGDKLLNLLIRDLQHTLSLRRGQGQRAHSDNSRVVRTPQKVEDSWNQKQNQPLFQRRERKSDLTN